MNISNALIQFNPSQVNLKQFDANRKVTKCYWNFRKFLWFYFKNQELKGNFNLNSNQLDVSDFMTTAEAGNTDTNRSDENPCL
jgi:hypothetical protein